MTSVTAPFVAPAQFVVDDKMCSLNGTFCRPLHTLSPQGGGTGKGAKGRGRRRGKRRGDFADGYDEMQGWNEVTQFSDFVYPCNAVYPS